jgi:coatomer subunit beta
LANKIKLAVAGPKPSDADYLAGNLYAKTIFDEEILINVCLEKSSSIVAGEDNNGEFTAAGRIVGHLRLRSKSQGVAVSLGDRILSILKPFKS